jgi:hypothetical protein
MVDFVEKVLSARRESKHIDFKGAADFATPSTWPELVKDIVAFANTGGGAMAIGLDNSGNPTGAEVSQVLGIDPAVVTDQIFKYTGVHFSDFEILERSKEGKRVALVLISGVSVPMVFTKPGTYKVDEKNQKSAFSAGSVYFRHGAKSEPGNTDDIRAVIERQLESIRKSWLKGVRKVVEAPPGSRILAFGPSVEVHESASPDAKAIRIVDDPDAPAYRKMDYDMTHPNRQMDVILKVNAALVGTVQINQWDIQCVKRLYNIEANEAYCHRGKFALGAQYSNRFVEWLIGEYRMNSEFFRDCRRRFYRMTH